MKNTIMADPHPSCESTHPRLAAWRRLGALFKACARHIPTACVLCRGRSRGGLLCAHCHRSTIGSMAGGLARCAVCRLALDVNGACPDCNRLAPAFDRVLAAFDYAPPGDLLIHQLKTGRSFTSAGMLAAMLADAVAAASPALHKDAILVPVPASRAAIVRRGFNPAAEIARCLAAQLRLPCRPGLLLRGREGARQTHLGRAQRASSTRLLYLCPQNVEGAHIAVVDDVLTTGSTLNSIALAFKDAGAASVTGLVLARTPCRPGRH
ncbi:ComF family protein [Pollutimonas sp. M17]|uniref:ComF family protein n=1 Tax=Pollutimonas sp. M17 TaxID=2962065 RepID=UPI0021F48937|nr:phosphoribosyltransferase family protein [Pollutimonas sp. M17]UYO93435.1 phosphoribosyltransferase family protein [Pollutimonas sp. M17]